VEWLNFGVGRNEEHEYCTSTSKYSCEASTGHLWEPTHGGALFDSQSPDCLFFMRDIFGLLTKFFRCCGHSKGSPRASWLVTSCLQAIEAFRQYSAHPLTAASKTDHIVQRHRAKPRKHVSQWRAKSVDAQDSQLHGNGALVSFGLVLRGPLAQQADDQSLALPWQVPRRRIHKLRQGVSDVVLE